VDKFSNGAIQTETVDVATTESENHLDSRTVGNVTGADTFSTVAKKILGTSVAAGPPFVNTENGSDTHVTVNVGASVKRVKSNAEFSRLARGDDNGFFVLLRDKYGADTRVDKSIDHDVIG
jgi:hypothetical protein